MTSKVTADVSDVTGRPDNTRWRFATPQPVREGQETGTIVTDRPRVVQPLDGHIEVDLEPGLAVVGFGSEEWLIAIPEEDANLWELIATAVAFPPDTQAEALASAVTTFLEENPVTSVITDGITDAGATGKAVVQADTQAQARSAIGAGTSNLAIGATGSTAKAGNWTPAAADISDSGAAGRAMVQADSADELRIAAGAAPAQRARYGAKTVVDGDSITIGAVTSSAWNQTRGGWVSEMARLSNGRVDLVYNAGVGGTGIATRLSNFASKVAAYSPETVILSNGTNDIAGMALNTYLTNLTAYYDLVRGIGAQLILGGIYPKNANQSTIATWNAALVEWAKTRGVLVIPFWELADPTTGEWPAGWSSDGTHPLRESPAFAALGALAWQTVARAFTEPVAPTARFLGEGIHTNFFTDLTATITGAATITAISATTGTLPAGDYTYRVVPRNYWGKNTSYADSSITLGGTGGVTLTSGGSGTYTRRAVYRKAPGETNFYFIGQITTAGSQTFTDNGTAAGYPWVDGDSSRVPTGLICGATQDLHTLEYGPPIRPGGVGDGIRGNILRLTRQIGSANARVDRFLITGLTAGNTITVTFKCRGPATTTATERVQLYFRDSGDATTIDTVPLVYHRLANEWALVFARVVVPTGSDRVRFSFEGDATSPWLDVAELRVA